MQVVKSDDRMRACNKFFGGVFGMPTYIPTVNEDKNLRILPRTVGIRRWLGIKYFSGTLFSLSVVFYNLSDKEKTVKCTYRLFRLSGVAGQEEDRYIESGQDSFNVKARGKIKRFWRFGYLPQSGEYSVTLRLTEGTKSGEADSVYFDALPRDATLWSLQIAVVTGIAMLILVDYWGSFFLSRFNSHFSIPQPVVVASKSQIVKLKQPKGNDTPSAG
jgi:hypothetical protein